MRRRAGVHRVTLSAWMTISWMANQAAAMHHTVPDADAAAMVKRTAVDTSERPIVSTKPATCSTGPLNAHPNSAPV